MVLTIISLVAGTFVEKIFGSDFAMNNIYHSVWFMALWAVLAISSLILLIQRKLYIRWQTFLIHISFLFIISGMIVTTFTAESGKMVLSKGKPASQFVSKDKMQKVYELPFSVELQNFEIVNYHGTTTPQDFVSDVIFRKSDNSIEEARISMNQIARHQGYRFYQSGYDLAGNVILTVTHDPWGIGLNYAGYILLLCSFILFFFDKKSEFREILKKASACAAPTAAVLLLLVALLPFDVAAAPKLPRTLPKESAEKMGEMFVYYNGRICPLQTLANDFTTKLYGAPTYKGLTPEQVLGGWIFYFSDWRDEPMFKIKGGYVKDILGVKGKYAKLTDYSDEYGNYKLKYVLDTMDFGNPQRSKLLAADEKFNLVMMLYGGELLKIFPVLDSSGVPVWSSQSDYLPLGIDDREFAFIRYYISYSQELALVKDYASLDTLWTKTLVYQRRNAADFLPSQTKAKAEILYNNISVGRTIAIVCIIIGLLFFAYALVCFGGHRVYSRYMRIAGLAALVFLSLYLVVLFVIRWYVAEHIPMGNGYETMLFLALCITVFGLLFSRRYPFAVPGGLLLTGFSLLVAMMGGANPSVTRLMPVLDSPLLCIHVAVIMTAYALLAFIALNGLAALGLAFVDKMLKRDCRADRLQRLQIVSQIMLYPAVFLLTVGIFVGAVWANVSWGTYWSWDPKEVWALITMLVYSIPLHSRFLTNFNTPLRFHLYMVLAFVSVLFTYFGVNFLLGGLHSYI